MMQDFRFANPEYLPLLIALPILYWVFARINRGGLEKLQKFLSAPNLAALLKERGQGGGQRKKVFFWAGLIFLILALARPQANPSVEELQGASLDIYVLLDVSRSMDAEDVAPSRLKKAKRSIQSLMQLLAGDRVGVIAFAGTAVIVSPLTADYEVVKIFLQGVDSTLIQNQGTDLGNALSMAEEAMARGAEKTGQDGTRSNVFVVMSDGEDHQQQDLSVVDRIKSQGGVVFSIAFGTEAGGNIPVRNNRGELAGYKRDQSGNQVKTMVQTASLKEIAEKGGGQFYFTTPGEQEIKDILDRVQSLDRSGAALMKARVYQEFFWLFLGVGALLLLLSFFSLRSLLRRPALTALALLLPGIAQASPAALLWDKEKRAFENSKKLAESGKTEEAVDELKGLLAEQPDSPELNYDIGTYLLQGKKNSEGRAQLGRIAEKENDLKEEALFNIAGSYGAEGKKPEARAAYAELLRHLKNKKEKSASDAAIAELARKNLARLADSSGQQEQQNQQNQSGDQGSQGSESPKDSKNPSAGEKGKNEKEEKKEDKEKGENEKPSEEKGKEEKKEGEEKPKDSPENSEGEGKEEKKPSPPPPGMRPAKPKFQEREDMGEEDAKRILEALKQRETGLQKGFLKKKANEGTFSEEEHGKDW